MQSKNFIWKCLKAPGYVSCSLPLLQLLIHHRSAAEKFISQCKYLLSTMKSKRAVTFEGNYSHVSAINCVTLLLLYKGVPDQGQRG